MATTVSNLLSSPSPEQRSADTGLSGHPSVLTRDDLEALQAGRRAHRPDKLPTGLDAGWHRAAAVFAMLKPRRPGILRQARRIDQARATYEQLGTDALHEKLDEARAAIRRQRDDPALRRQALALVAVQAHRTLGLRAYGVQLAGALAMERGMLAEMATGEGKTLSAALAGTLMAWRGRGCHIVTVNDYLAIRDAEWMRPFYASCGLTVQHVDPQMDPTQKRSAYRAGVTYATNKELTADYLRDQLTHRRGGLRQNAPPIMRDLWYAIIDEADSVLIDEAATPLIISTKSGDTQRTEAIRQATRMADQFQPDRHYKLDRSFRQVEFTAGGRKLVERCADGLDGVWRIRRLRQELINQALVARDLHTRDRDYVVADDRIVIVDPSTGRQMPDRTWSQGIHQAVEAKEDLDVQPINETLARMSFQRYFRGYRFLAGMTGTAWEARHELWRIYGLPVVRIPRHKPLRRRDARPRVLSTDETRWAQVADQIISRYTNNQPVLVGTTSVHESEVLSQALTSRNIPHQVLNALTHEQEAKIIAGAGQPGAVTVATNMAGRGTDILLGPGVAERSGLHVIAAAPNRARRIDRQLLGRCARQGDPGSTARFASLDDDLLRQHSSAWLRSLMASAPHTVRRWVVALAQRRAERVNRLGRRRVLRSDDWLDQNLGFARDLV